MLLLVNAWGSHVNLWGTVYKTPLTLEISSLHGLFYVDFHRLAATKLYCGVLIGIAIVIVFNIFWRRRLLWYVTAGAWGLSYVLLLHVYPIGISFVQRMSDHVSAEDGEWTVKGFIDIYRNIGIEYLRA